MTILGHILGIALVVFGIFVLIVMFVRFKDFNCEDVFPTTDITITFKFDDQKKTDREKSYTSEITDSNKAESAENQD